MYDIEVVRDLLQQILKSCRTIKRRFEPVTSPDDFISTEAGWDRLDAICMQHVLSHQYSDLDPETVFSVCVNYLTTLQVTIELALTELCDCK